MTNKIMSELLLGSFPTVAEWPPFEVGLLNVKRYRIRKDTSSQINKISIFISSVKITVDE